MLRKGISSHFKHHLAPTLGKRTARAVGKHWPLSSPGQWQKVLPRFSVPQFTPAAPSLSALPLLDQATICMGNFLQGCPVNSLLEVRAEAEAAGGELKEEALPQRQSKVGQPRDHV